MSRASIIFAALFVLFGAMYQVDFYYAMPWRGLLADLNGLAYLGTAASWVILFYLGRRRAAREGLSLTSWILVGVAATWWPVQHLSYFVSGQTGSPVVAPVALLGLLVVAVAGIARAVRHQLRDDGRVPP